MKLAVRGSIHLSVRSAACSSQGDQVARVGCGGEADLAEHPTDTAGCPRSAVVSIAFSKQESRAASARRSLMIHAEVLSELLARLQQP